MSRLIVSLLSLLLFVGFASAQAKKDDKPTLTGVWTKEHDGAELAFDFSKPGTVLVVVSASDKSITMTCKYTVDKDGLVKATAEKVENKNEFPAGEEIKKGYEFKMKIKVDGKKATVSGFEAVNADAAKNIVEGEYKLKEKK